MWIFTTSGFYSIVRHRQNPKHLLVRARARADLEKFVREAPPLEGEILILETPDADYPFRCEVHADVVADWIDAEVTLIDYDNFKAAVPRTRARVYGKVWGILRAYFAADRPRGRLRPLRKA